MSWMSKKSAEKLVVLMLNRMEENGMIILKSKKKDRIVSIKKENKNYIIHEEGFKIADYNISEDKDLKKMLKDLIEFEFPRSHEILVTKQKDKE